MSINNIDTNNYHKLIASGIMFNSVKGKSFSIAISFKQDDFYRYFKQSSSTPVLMGKMIIYSVQGTPQIHNLVFREDLFGVTDINSVEPWATLTSKVLFDETTMKSIVLKRGQYILIPEIYIPKNIPNNIPHIIKMMELDQFK